MIATTANRICQKCLEPKPLTEYRRRWSDSDVRMNVCNSCHYASERARRARKKQEAIDRIVTNYIRKWRRGKAFHADFWDCHWKIRKLNRRDQFLDLLTARIGREEALRAYRGQPSEQVRSA